MGFAVSKQGLELGDRGEEIAAGLLEESGYKVLFRNYKTKSGEIDIIARDKDTLCFVEVKARSSRRFGPPAEAVSGRKLRQISKAALVFLKENKLLNEKARFDVVSILYSEGKPRLDLIKDAFELDPGFTY